MHYLRDLMYYCDLIRSYDYDCLFVKYDLHVILRSNDNVGYGFRYYDAVAHAITVRLDDVLCNVIRRAAVPDIKGGLCVVGQCLNQV